MEMQEKKKFMPTITNYLSDDDDFEECFQVNSNNSQLQTNYAEWKKLKKNNQELSNGKKPRIRSDGSIEPLGDISSSDENYGIDDNEPMFKVIKNLADKDMLNRRTTRLKKKPKLPSMFLLFSRMTHLKYQQSSQDWTFNELCRITHSSWENIQPSETEDLKTTMDQRIREYGDLLLKFRSVLMPDSTGRLKYKSWVTAAVATKEHGAPVAAAIVAKELAVSPAVITIPERLQNLVGKASVYHASAVPSKFSRNARHSLFSYRSVINNNNDYSSETSLNYVASAVETCKFEQCTNQPVQDSRWDGQYCSAKCLINHCRDTFETWLADQKSGITTDAVAQPSETVPVAVTTHSVNGASKSRLSSSTVADDDEIMQYLTDEPASIDIDSFPEHHDHKPDRPNHRDQQQDLHEDRQVQRNHRQVHRSDSDESINRDENLFASLQQHYFPSLTKKRDDFIDLIDTEDNEPETNNAQNSVVADRNDDLELLSPIKLQNSPPGLCSPNPCTSVTITSHSDG